METKSAGRIIVKKFVAGIVVGVTLAVGTTAFADQIKQYILTAVSYPIFVNGKEFNDSSAPVLNYEGSTYVPLAKLGDLTGVNYKWNESLKRVEIDTKPAVQPPTATPGVPGTPSVTEVTPALPQGVTLKPDTKVVEPKGLVVENEKVYFYAYDREGNYKGKFTDEDDDAFVSAQPVNDALPRLSTGWMQGGLLQEIYGFSIAYDIDHKNVLVIATSKIQTKPQELLRITLPTDWREKEAGDFEFNGLKVKRYGGINYFSVDGLKKVGLIG
jgi:hypothetical protein